MYAKTDYISQFCFKSNFSPILDIMAHQGKPGRVKHHIFCWKGLNIVLFIKRRGGGYGLGLEFTSRKLIICLAYSPVGITMTYTTESNLPGTIKSPYAVLYDFDTQ